MATDRVVISLSPELAEQVRERQETIFQQTRVRVSLAEIARSLMEIGLAQHTYNGTSAVSSSAQ